VDTHVHRGRFSGWRGNW
jgi:Flp pilus assembly protein TadB